MASLLSTVGGFIVKAAVERCIPRNSHAQPTDPPPRPSRLLKPFG